MEETDFDVFRKVYDWFQYKLIVIYPETQIGASYFLFNSDNKKLVNILKYLDAGITDYNMRTMNEAAFKEYFPDESLAEKFLRKSRRHDQAPSKGILNFGNTLFELDYGKEGG